MNQIPKIATRETLTNELWYVKNNSENHKGKKYASGGFLQIRATNVDTLKERPICSMLRNKTDKDNEIANLLACAPDMLRVLLKMVTFDYRGKLTGVQVYDGEKDDIFRIFAHLDKKEIDND